MAVVALGGTTFDPARVRARHLAAPGCRDEFSSRSLVNLPAVPVASIGGNAGNTAYALARLGCIVTGPIAPRVPG